MNSMTTLAAVGHITGSVVTLLVLGVLMVLIASWEAERNKKRVLEEAAAKLGIAVESLNDERLTNRVIRFWSERSSNELLSNRVSDLCGLARTAWGVLGSLLQVGILGAAVWFGVTAERDNALYAWFAPGAAVFFWVTSVIFSLLCYFLTGRYPGEAKLGRKGLVQFLNERRIVDATDA